MDPTRNEMLAAFVGAPLTDEIDREAAMYWFASRWHAGQASNLCAALSASPYRPGPFERGPEQYSGAESAYWVLERVFLPKAWRWAIGREYVTDESAENGEADRLEHESGLTFREAIAAFRDADSEGGIAADSYPISRARPPRCFVAYSKRDAYSGEFCNVSLHVPDHVSPASRMRIARLVGAYGSGR